MIHPERLRWTLHTLLGFAIFWVATLGVLGWPRLAQAALITVSTTSDFDVDDADNNCTLPEAILAANNNAVQDSCAAGDDSPTDTVVLASGAIYNLPSSYASYDSPRALPAITSTLTISGNNATIARIGSDPFGLLYIAPTVGNLTLANLTLTNGNSQNGGAIFNEGTLTLHNSQIITNTASHNGGGVYNSAILTMTDTLLRANVAITAGGALYQANGQANITDSRLLANKATQAGGAIEQAGGVVTIHQNCIVDNSAYAVNRSGGGFIFAENNWWASPDGPGDIRSGSGDSIYADVNYTPFLTHTIQACPSRSVALSFTNSVTPTDNLLPAQPVTYTLAITNEGDLAIYNLNLQNTLPTGVNAAPVTAGSAIFPNGGGFIIPNLAVGEVATVMYVGYTDGNLNTDQLLTNSATLSHVVAGSFDAGVSSNLVVPKISLSAAAYHAAEDSGPFTVTVVVSPTTPYESVGALAVYTDTYQPSLNIAGETHFEIPPNSSSQTIVIDISDDESRTPRTITLGLQDPFNAELSNPISATLYVTDTDFLGIELELNATPFEVRLGEQITYTYRVTNRGTVMLENIRIEDDHGTSFTMGSIFPSQTITGTGGTLASEEDLPSPIERTAVVTATDELGESVTDSDSASVTVVQYKTMLLYVERQ